VEKVVLEDAGIRPRQGFDAWDREGKLAFRTMQMSNVFRRHAAFFRVNSTGKVYRVVSRYKTVEVNMAKLSGDLANPRSSAGTQANL